MVALLFKVMAPFTNKFPLKTEPSPRVNAPFICQYTLRKLAELISKIFVLVVAANAPSTLKINTALGLP